MNKFKNIYDNELNEGFFSGVTEFIKGLSMIKELSKEVKKELEQSGITKDTDKKEAIKIMVDIFEKMFKSAKTKINSLKISDDMKKTLIDSFKSGMGEGLTKALINKGSNPKDAKKIGDQLIARLN